MLYAACKNNDLNQVKLILERTPNELDQRVGLQNETALHVAVRYGFEEIVKVLLNHQASLETVDIHRKTPLHIAVEYQHEALVDLLIKNEAPLDKQDDKRMMPISIAMDQGYESIINRLLKEPLAKPYVNKNHPIYLAIKNKTHLLKTILEAIPCTEENPHWYKESINFAIRLHNKEALSILLQSNYRSNVKLALYTSIHYGFEEGVSLMLSNFEYRYILLMGKTPLYAAIEKGSIPIIKHLLQAGFSLIKPCPYGTPIERAYSLVNWELLEWLLNQDVSLIRVSFENQTSPLHLTILSSS